MDGVPIYARSVADGPLRQGEILSEVNQIRLAVGAPEFPKPSDQFPVELVQHPFAIVISQDCDLDWDYRSRQQGKLDKELPNVLLCEVSTAEELRGRDIKSDLWKRIRINKDERYQFLQKVESEYDLQGHGVPELGLDFKRCFSLPTRELYLQVEASKAKRRCRLLSPYLEHFAHRLHSFQSRIGLPAEHESEPVI